VFQDVNIDPFTSHTMIKVTLSVNDILTMDFTYVLAMIYIYWKTALKQMCPHIDDDIQTHTIIWPNFLLAH
jgi:hypothetical protein